MNNDNMYQRFTLRFRKNNKREAAILRVLDDLNLEIHKSKNQFIVDAIEYYMAHFDDKELIGPTADAGKQRYISRTEMNGILEDINDDIQVAKDEIRSQLYEDMLKLFIGGSNFMNAALTIQTNNNSFPSEVAQPNLEQSEEDDSLVDDVMKWS